MGTKQFIRQWFLPPGFRKLLKNAKPSIKALWGGRRPKSLEEPIVLSPDGATAAEIQDLLVAPYGEIVWVPVEKIRSWGRGLTREQNQHVRYFSEGVASFRRFYELHQPENQMEDVFVGPEESGEFVPIRFPRRRVPWSFQTVFTGSEKRHGDQNSGPISEKKLRQEIRRLDVIQAAVLARGFLNMGRDFIHFGYLLIDDTDSEKLDYRVTVARGFHRTSLLAFLGWPVVPMNPEPTCPMRAVKLSQLNDWPGVQDGVFSPQAARAYFLAHFRDPNEILIPDW